jgi:hypothetical protein
MTDNVHWERSLHMVFNFCLSMRDGDCDSDRDNDCDCDESKQCLECYAHKVAAPFFTTKFFVYTDMLLTTADCVP